MSTKIPLYQDIESTNVPNVATWLGFYKNESHLFHFCWKLFGKLEQVKLLNHENHMGCRGVNFEITMIFDVGFPNPLYVHNSLHRHACALVWGEIIPIK